MEPDQPDDNCKGWKQLKLMFEGEDRQGLQTLIDNQTIMSEDIKKPRAALDAIGTTIKSKEHFWAHRDELISDVRQQPGKGIHVLSQHISNLITQCRFTHPKTQDMLKIMVLQHAVRYHEARDWKRQQDQSQLTYQSLLSHCKLLETRCKQYQKRRERGCTNLASITVLQHPPFIPMTLQPHPTPSATNVAILIPLPSAQHMDNNAMHVAAPTISLHSANREDGDSLANRCCTKVTALPREVTASTADAASATLPAGTTTRAPAIAHPIVLPTAQPIAHPLAI